MKNSLSIALLLSCLLCEASVSASRTKLNDWIVKDLTPYVAEQLRTQPRFKNESIRFVVLDNEHVQSSTSQLALTIRDQLRDALAGIPGLRISWQQDPATPTKGNPIDCTKDQASYYIGVGVVDSRNGTLNVDVRALDVLDRSWVAGFSQSWTGYPSAEQRRQLRQTASDPTLLGQRGAPFNDAQFDLLASHLARELGCSLLRQTAGEYVVTGADTVDEDESAKTMLELVGNNLSSFRAVQFSNEENKANALFSGKAHRVDDELFQYWVTITPIATESKLTTLSASAYLRINDKYAIASLVPALTIAIAKADAGYLGALKVVELRDAQQCANTIDRVTNNRYYGGRFSPAVVDCFALEVGSQNDAVLFFLNHQLNNGLVRLSGKICDRRTDARIARNDSMTRFALPVDALTTSAWTTASAWQVDPDEDTFYVIAASDTRAARALSQHIRELPNRCTASVRAGFEGKTLERWMDQFATLTNHFEKSIDWKVIRVKNMY